jgi:hypothetical protein
MKKTKHWSEALEGAMAEFGIYTATSEPVSSEWFRADELMKQTGKGDSSCRHLIRRLIESNKLEKKFFKIKRESGKIIPTPHYRFK